MATQEYSLAPGHNNTAGYVVVENTTVSGVKFVHVQGVGTYDDGEEVTFVDGSKDDQGEAMYTWLFTKMTLAQYDWLYNTPNAGRRSNRVTSRTRFKTLTYQDVNAIMTLPKTSTLARSYGNYLDVPVTFLVKGIIA
jgi:hypothetical protein